MQPGTRLHAVLQAGHQKRQAVSVGKAVDVTKPAGGLATPKTTQPTSSDPRQPTGVTKTTGPEAADMLKAAKGKYLPGIQSEIDKYNADRKKDVDKLVAALDEVQKCRAKQDAAIDVERKEVERDANGIIASLASQLTRKSSEYDVVQKKLEELAKAGEDAKGQNAKALEAAEAALAAEKMERATEVAGLKDKLKDCQSKAEAEKNLCKQQKDAMEAKLLKGTQDAQAAHEQEILAKDEEIKRLTDLNATCGDEDKAKLVALQKTLEKLQKEQAETVAKNNEMSELYKKVCELLKCK